MKDIIIVERYAEAYIDFAKEALGIDKAAACFKELKDIILRNPEFQEILSSLELTYAEKSDFIEQVLNQDFPEEIKEFLRLLLRKGRIDKVMDIAEYIRVKYSFDAELDVLLKISFPLDLEVIKTIKERLELKFQKRLKFFIELDGSLLGGVQVIFGNTIIDGSVRRKLDDLRQRLMSVRVA